MKKRIINAFKYIPQNILSKSAGVICSSPLSKPAVRLFAKLYKIDLNESEKELSDYKSMNEFFTRRLKAGARKMEGEANDYVSPVDGTIAEFGKIEEGQLIQAKGIKYKVESLVGEKELAERYKNGHFLTIYLAPSNYHRIHMPTDAAIEGYNYIPGRLFPVNSIGVEHIEGLFTKNERLISILKRSDKKIAVVKIGAFIVGSTKVSYDEVSTNKGLKKTILRYHKKIEIKKGEELGWFEFGSTVVLLFEKDEIIWNEQVKKGHKIKMGNAIGKRQIKTDM